MSWERALPRLLSSLVAKDDDAAYLARCDLRRMAQLADELVELKAAQCDAAKAAEQGS